MISKIINIIENKKTIKKIFDNILLILIIQIFCIMAIFYSKMLKTLFFKGFNITNFFN